MTLGKRAWKSIGGFPTESLVIAKGLLTSLETASSVVVAFWMVTNVPVRILLSFSPPGGIAVLSSKGSSSGSVLDLFRPKMARTLQSNFFVA